MVEALYSLRSMNRKYYYSIVDNAYCTIGGWHTHNQVLNNRQVPAKVPGKKTRPQRLGTAGGGPPAGLPGTLGGGPGGGRAGGGPGGGAEGGAPPGGRPGRAGTGRLGGAGGPTGLLGGWLALGWGGWAALGGWVG